MKIAFIASHSQKERLMPYYKRIVDCISAKKFDVYYGSLFETKQADVDEQELRRKWYGEAINEIKKSDIVVVELSYPSSANVGHEMTYALELGKPVVCLYKKDRDPFFLMGIEHDKLTIVSYTDNDLEEVLEGSLEYAMELQDTRFNFLSVQKLKDI